MFGFFQYTFLKIIYIPVRTRPDMNMGMDFGLGWPRLGTLGWHGPFDLCRHPTLGLLHLDHWALVMGYDTWVTVAPVWISRQKLFSFQYMHGYRLILPLFYPRGSFFTEHLGLVKYRFGPFWSIFSRICTLCSDRPDVSRGKMGRCIAGRRASQAGALKKWHVFVENAMNLC